MQIIKRTDTAERHIEATVLFPDGYTRAVQLPLGSTEQEILDEAQAAREVEENH